MNGIGNISLKLADRDFGRTRVSLDDAIKVDHDEAPVTGWRFPPSEEFVEWLGNDGNVIGEHGHVDQGAVCNHLFDNLIDKHDE